MKYLRMTVPQSVVAPASAVTEGYILNMQLLPDGTLLELALIRAQPDELRTMLETSPNTDHFTYDVAEAQDGQCYIYQHCRPTEQAREILQLFNDYRLMIIFPITYDEETGITLEIIGRESDVQHGFDALPEEIRRQALIERVDEYSPMTPDVVSVLTDRQREVLDAAAAVGYYDVPRRGTAADVAAVVGCAASTASEHLRKIEARILSTLAED